jgi:dCMP deaminase
MNWNQYFRGIAEMIKEKSKDKYTKIGAVIVGKDNEIVSTGYNSFPRGIDDSQSSRQERPEKYYWFEHAERNAIYNAARIGVSTKGCRMYLTCGVPCSDCARGIINSGIVEIFVQRNDKLSAKWEESANRSLEMFDEAGVQVQWLDSEILL